MKVKTLRGKVLDLTKIVEKQGKKIAAGNAKMNGHGDKLGYGGKVVKQRQEYVAEYNQAPPKTVKNVSLHDLSNQVMTPQEALKSLPAKERRKRLSDAD